LVCDDGTSIAMRLVMIQQLMKIAVTVAVAFTVGCDSPATLPSDGTHLLPSVDAAQQDAGTLEAGTAVDAAQPDGAIDAQRADAPPADAIGADATPLCIADNQVCTDMYGRGCCSSSACTYSGTMPDGGILFLCRPCSMTGVNGASCCLDNQGQHICAFNYECINMGYAGQPRYVCSPCSVTPSCCNMRDYPCP
jgi:hypothetical protein